VSGKPESVEKFTYLAGKMDSTENEVEEELCKNKYRKTDQRQIINRLKNRLK
jgi:hypothetical protein